MGKNTTTHVVEVTRDEKGGVVVVSKGKDYLYRYVKDLKNDCWHLFAEGRCIGNQRLLPFSVEEKIKKQGVIL